MGDSMRIRQILLNLISNALKFTDKGSVKIIVSHEVNDENITWITTKIVDTGIGIKKSELQNIFKSFSQADVSTTRKYGGTGLGTTISKKIVEAMKGDLTAHSNFGIGSEFTVSLPFELGEALNEVKTSLDDHHRAYNKTVIVAEDNLVNQKLIIKTLNKLGIKILMASNGVELLDISINNEHDLILMDIQMPTMDGMETMECLNKRGYGGPIIAMTANVLPEQVLAYSELGFQGHLSKPFKIEELIEILDIYL